LSASAQSGATNFFNDGTDGASTDAYPGVPGNGWLSAWTPVLTTGIFITNPNVVTNPPDGAPLNGGGNYLNWRVGGTTAGASTLYRQLDINGGLDFSRPYIVEFDYRHDAFITATTTNTTLATAVVAGWSGKNDYVSFQQAGNTGNDVRNKVGFWIKAQSATTSTVPSLLPRTWSFFDGNLGSSAESLGLWVNSTNVPYAFNTVFHFKLEVEPLNHIYDGTVSNTVNNTVFNTKAATGRSLRWQSAIQSGTDIAATTILGFISRQNAVNTTNQHSLDNLVVYQASQDVWPIIITNINPSKGGTFGPPWYPATSFTGTPMYPASSNLIFGAVTSGLTNTIPAANTHLYMNGVDVSGSLTATGTDSDTNRTFTFAGLKDNKVYNVVITSADQAGRTSSNIFFFNTFQTNVAVLFEGENFNFDPAAAPCDVANQTDVQNDRYIQNWLYAGLSGITGAFTNSAGGADTTNSYYARRGVEGIDYHTTDTTGTGGNFRTCMAAITINNESSQDYIRHIPFDLLGIRDNTMRRVGTNEWFNYTHEWPNTNYIAYLRGGASVSNYVYELDDVTSDYTASGQTSNKLAKFDVPLNFSAQVLRDNALTDDAGLTAILPLNGKKTLKLAIVKGDSAVNNNSIFSSFVFLPVPPIVIANPSMSGSTFSFQFNPVGKARYIVEYKDSLTDPAWTTLTSVTGAVDTGVGPDLVATVTDTTGGSSRLYRVRLP
jgi:hypothetical protein